MYESATGTDNSLAERLLAVLRQAPAGLVTDIDGTLSPIVPRPEQARLLPGARRALRQLRGRLAVVAVVSGRAAADARRLVGVAGLVYVGNHGLDLATDRGAAAVPEARPWLPRLARVVEQLRPRLRTPGLLVEDKGASASIHYRNAPDREAARREVLERLADTAQASGLRVEEGRMVVNLLPPVAANKGSAVRWLARERALRGLVYLGDDVTDTHAFEALAEMRRSERLATLSVGVVGPETPPAVRQLADASVGSPQAAAALLESLAAALARGGP